MTAPGAHAPAESLPPRETPGRRRTLLMGVVNVTPDSFSDGGRFLRTEDAVAQGERLLAAGADILDIGGESTRPGHRPTPEAVQIERVVPVIAALRARHAAPISMDTTWSSVARAALDVGATWVNDTKALRDDEDLAGLAARSGATLVLMHRFEPARQQGGFPAPGRELARLVGERLAERAAIAMERGVARERIVLDPGIGFGTLPEDAVALHAFCDELRSTGFPLLFGTSRKSFLGALTGRAVHEREFATAASVALLARAGVEVLRVHDVAAMRDVVAVADAIRWMEARP